MPYISELKSKIYNEKYRFVIENKQYFYVFNCNKENKYSTNEVNNLIKTNKEKSVWIINPDNISDVQNSIKKIEGFIKALSKSSKEGTIEDQNRLKAEKELKEWRYWLNSFQILLNAISH